MISQWLVANGAISLNPLAKPEQAGADRRTAYRLNGDYDLLTAEMQTIAKLDLEMVSDSDFVICHLDATVSMCGTIWEVCIAHQQNIPVIFHCEQGKQGMPLWLFAMFPHSQFFGSWAEVQNYLLN